MSTDPWADNPCRPGADAWSLPLGDFDVTNPRLFAQDAWEPFFARLRRDAPVHACHASPFGPYWSVTRFQDIRYVDTHHSLFSSEPTVLLGNPPKDFYLQPGFIAMDPPRHTQTRAAVQPAVGAANLALLEPLIRTRVQAILDALPLAQEFDWVEEVSIALTTQMLATLFDFPFAERHLLTYWSDVAISSPRNPGPLKITAEEWRATMRECLARFTQLWTERATAPARAPVDLVTLMAQDPSTRAMAPMEYLGNLVLLIVGGNDTTRHSLTGGVLALHEHPAEFAKLRAHPALVNSLVPEIIRWQTPLAYMRRTAVEDTEIGGQQIRAGDKVVMWYLSGNRDESEIPDAHRFIVDRPNPRHHLGFGFGIHRCMGNRLAEMQLRIAWEEILQRFARIEVCGTPERVMSCFVHGFERLPVRVYPR